MSRRRMITRKNLYRVAKRTARTAAELLAECDTTQKAVVFVDVHLLHPARMSVAIRRELWQLRRHPKKLVGYSSARRILANYD